MRGAVGVFVTAIVAGGLVALLLHARRGAVDRQLDADLAAALARGGIGDLGRAQALGRRLVLTSGGGRAAAAALAFADARLAIDFGVPSAAEAQEVLARSGLPDAGQDAISAMAAGAKALSVARAGERRRGARLAAEASATAPAVAYPLYALGRIRALGGDLVGAVRAFDGAIVVAPVFLASRVARATALLDLGDARGALAGLAAVLVQAPGNPSAQLLQSEAEAALPAQESRTAAPPICADGQWRPPAIEAGCLLARAARSRRAGNRTAARADAERAARVVPEQARLLARTALLLAQLGAVDRAAALVARARRLAAPGMPALAWATAAVALGRGHAAVLPAGPRPADPETALLTARAALALGGRGALHAALGALGPAARADDADLRRLARFAARVPTAAGADDPMQAYLDGLAAQLAGNLPRATKRFARGLSGHGDACRAVAEYRAALRAQKRRPEPAVFAPLRAESAHCVNLR